MTEKRTVGPVEEFSDWLEAWLQAKEKLPECADDACAPYQAGYVDNCRDALTDYLEAEGRILLAAIREMQEEINSQKGIDLTHLPKGKPTAYPEGGPTR